MSGCGAGATVPPMGHVACSEARYPDLVGRVAVVTGGSRAIGAGTARALAAQGAQVAVVGRDRDALRAVVQEIATEGGTAVAVATDLTTEAGAERLRSEVRERLGGADIVVACAGGGGQGVGTGAETLGHWHEVVDQNLTTTFLTVHALLGDLVTRRGVVVTMSSESGRRPTRASAAYAAANGGVVALSRHLAGELAPSGVRVNCVAPATVENEKIRAHTDADQRRAMAQSIPLGRLGQPRDVAALVLFLVSEVSSWLTGATIDLSGGRTMV